MFSKILVIAFLRVGSVIMDANLKEFCSRNYFDSFKVQNKGFLGQNMWDETYDFQLTRKIDSKSYHSWHILMEEETELNTGSLKKINISYKLEEGQTPTNRLSKPEYCYIPLFHKATYLKKNKNYLVYITDLQIINDKIDGPKLIYQQNYTDPKVKFVENTKERTIRLNSSGIWLSGLFCRHHKTLLTKIPDMYVIVEKTDSINSWDRTQFVSRLRIEPGPKFNVKTVEGIDIISPKPKIWLESMNQTILEFLGIECPDQHTVPTDTLFILMCILAVIAVILVIAIAVVAHYRKKWIKFPTESVDGTDVTTYDSEASRRRDRDRATEEIMKAFRLLGARTE